jgi:hypothetical protein
MLRGVTKKQWEHSRLLGTWYLAVFQKKIRNKTFYFHTKKKFTLFFFYLVLALESISRVKSWLFCQINFWSQQSFYVPSKLSKVDFLVKPPWI